MTNMENKDQPVQFSPNYCCIALLESCFFHCKMCYKWQEDINNRDPEEPDLEQWKHFLRDFAQHCQQKPQINFAGGEPLARQETLELMNFASELGFDTLLATNGYLIDENIAQAIGKSKVHCVSISLDSIDPEIHDKLRGKQGSCEKVIKAIDLLHKHAPDTMVDLCALICQPTLNGLVDLIKWADENPHLNGIGFQAVTQPFSTPIEKKWYENPKYSSLWPKDPEEVDKVLDRIMEMVLSGSLKNRTIKTPLNQFRVFKRYFRNPESFLKKGTCHISVDAVNITPTGNVHICFYKPAIGNIKDSSIKDIWFSEKARNTRKLITECTRNCQSLVNCNFEEKEEYIC
jgi:MoaA/NifB/PqqE/SkfB family radical SAM enzyme